MLALATTVTPPRAHAGLKTRVRASTCLRATRVGKFRAQLSDRTREIATRRRRLATGSRKYLSPEPLLQEPMYVRRMAQTGVGVPTYSYAANNPLRYSDPSGLEIVPNWADQNLVRAIDRFLATPAGKAQWARLHKRPERIFLSSRDAAFDPVTGLFEWGHTPRRKGNQACYVDTRPEWEGTAYDPASTIGHELDHAETNLTSFNMSKPDRETKALLRQMFIDLQLSP